MVPILLLVVPIFSTMAGGLLALRLRGSLTLLVALGAGLLLGAAFLDLLPEAIVIGPANGVSTTTVLALTLLSFLLFLSIQIAIARIAARYKDAGASRRVLGQLGGSMLIFHSF